MTSSPPPGWTFCAGWSRLPQASAVTPPRCCSGRPGSWSCSTWAWPARLISTRWGAALAIGHLAAGSMTEISRAVRALPPSPAPSPAELLLDGLTLLITDGLAAAAPALRQAASAFASDSISAGDGLRWGYLATVPPLLLWDDDGWRAIVARQVRLARNAGALENLPLHLRAAGIITAWSGAFGAAAALIAEVEAVCEATGSANPVLRRPRARWSARQPGRGRPAVRRHDQRGRSRGPGPDGDLRALDGRRPVQRPGPLRGGAGGGPAGRRGTHPGSTSPCGRCPS